MGERTTNPHRTVVTQFRMPSPHQQPYRLVHISDPHLSYRYYPEHLASFRLLLKAIVEHGCDHLLITGDIVSTADPADFLLAREILSQFDLLHSSKLTVVPGNHDIFGGPHRAIDVLSFPQYIRSVDYSRHLRLFIQTFEETFDRCTYPARGYHFPFLKQVGPFVILGINSVPPWSLWNNPFGSSGAIQGNQWNALLELQGQLLPQGKIFVAALHHHLYSSLHQYASNNPMWRLIEQQTMRIRKRTTVLRLFKSLGIRYIFHGHIHRNELYLRNGLRCINGAGAVCDDSIPWLKFNTLTYTHDTCTLRIQCLPIPFQQCSPSLQVQKVLENWHTENMVPVTT
jgi:Icc protein